MDIRTRSREPDSHVEEELNENVLKIAHQLLSSSCCVISINAWVEQKFTAIGK